MTIQIFVQCFGALYHARSFAFNGLFSIAWLTLKLNEFEIGIKT